MKKKIVKKNIETISKFDQPKGEFYTPQCIIDLIVKSVSVQGECRVIPFVKPVKNK